MHKKQQLAVLLSLFLTPAAALALDGSRALVGTERELRVENIRLLVQNVSGVPLWYGWQIPCISTSSESCKTKNVSPSFPIVVILL